uniref:Uncharacterized protein n=1 Tax=Pseudonaja textilis TaxID=8673 RepID=A0A670Z6M7_PSETE
PPSASPRGRPCEEKLACIPGVQQAPQPLLGDAAPEGRGPLPGLRSDVVEGKRPALGHGQQLQATRRLLRLASAAPHEAARAAPASDLIRTIRDPEKPNTLEELEVVSESGVEVAEIGPGESLITIRFTPTVPHCSLATLIGRTPPRALGGIQSSPGPSKGPRPDPTGEPRLSVPALNPGFSSKDEPP